MPLSRRIPKRGFHSPFRVEYQVVNVRTLQKLAADGKVTGGVVTPELLAKLGVLKGADARLKVLGTGDITVKLDVAAHAFSKSALQKIETAGGKAQTISSTPKTNG